MALKIALPETNLSAPRKKDAWNTRMFPFGAILAYFKGQTVSFRDGITFHINRDPYIG